MSWQDFANAAFEAWGAVAVLGNCAALYKDKKVRGVKFSSMAFFTSWGFWNLYYYPHLGQWASFAAGIAIVLGNCVWVTLAWRYRRN